MKPTIGKRAGLYKRQEEKKLTPTRHFVKVNTHHNIVLKREFMYIEDVKEAINNQYSGRTDKAQEMA